MGAFNAATDLMIPAEPLRELGPGWYGARVSNPRRTRTSTPRRRPTRQPTRTITLLDKLYPNGVVARQPVAAVAAALPVNSALLHATEVNRRSFPLVLAGFLLSFLLVVYRRMQG